MSMLSGQCDELRQVAQVYRNLGKFATEQMLLDAADTILELRDDLQRANDAVRDAEHEESVAWDRVRKAEAESAKLRELCTALYKCRDKVSECGTCEDVACPFMDDCRLHDRMRKLGIEVE